MKYCSLKLDSCAVGITVGSRGVPGRTPVTRDNIIIIIIIINALLLLLLRSVHVCFLGTTFQLPPGYHGSPFAGNT
jgi:hypothetical protein